MIIACGRGLGGAAAPSGRRPSTGSRTPSIVRDRGQHVDRLQRPVADAAAPLPRRLQEEGHRGDVLDVAGAHEAPVMAEPEAHTVIGHHGDERRGRRCRPRAGGRAACRAAGRSPGPGADGAGRPARRRTRCRSRAARPSRGAPPSASGDRRAPRAGTGYGTCGSRMWIRCSRGRRPPSMPCTNASKRAGRSWARL